jgi:hypothetical protein
MLAPVVPARLARIDLLARYLLASSTLGAAVALAQWALHR